MLEIVTFQLGPVITNAYLVADSNTKEAVVIDPAWDGQIIAAEAGGRGWDIRQIWVTHAHFDHMGGTGGLVAALNLTPSVALHPADLPLWRAQGGAPLFGFRLAPTREPDIELRHGQRLRLGEYGFEVRHAPGHTPGHVMFYCADISTALEDARSVRREGVLFAGDVIFRQSIGRTDLPGGDFDTLIRSIREQVLTLPDATRILSGHMGETTVGEERRGNPFLV